MRLWRLMPRDRASDWAEPVRRPEGRFHHEDQPALYASLSAEGAEVALARYEDADRDQVALTLDGGKIFDLTSDTAAAPPMPGIDRETAMARWQEDLATGRHPATWVLSDRLRAAGWDGLIYPSRQRPDLAHIVLFHWNAVNAPVLRLADPDGSGTVDAG